MWWDDTSEASCTGVGWSQGGGDQAGQHGISGPASS